MCVIITCVLLLHYISKLQSKYSETTKLNSWNSMTEPKFATDTK